MGIILVLVYISHMVSDVKFLGHLYFTLGEMFSECLAIFKSAIRLFVLSCALPIRGIDPSQICKCFLPSCGFGFCYLGECLLILSDILLLILSSDTLTQKHI